MRLVRGLWIAQARAAGVPLTCRRCLDPIDLTLSGLHPMGLTVGHVLAVRDGGTDAPDNLAPEHRSCNLGGRQAPRVRATIARPPHRRID